MTKDPKKIGIFRVGHIGDTIIALPAFWTVRKRFPSAHILYLTQQHQSGKLAQGLDVLRKGTVFDDSFSYSLGSGGVSKLETVKTLLRLRREKLDMLVYLPPYRTAAQLARDEKFFKLAGVKQIVGMRGYSQTDYHPEGKPLKLLDFEADTLLSHLKLDGISIDEDSKELTGFGFSAEELALAENWFKKMKIDRSKPIIAVAPGSKMAAKIWPIDRMTETLRTIDAKFQPTFILFGGPIEREDCEKCARSVTNGVNTAGELSIRESAAIMSKCSLYVGIDSGPMHIAAAEKVPCVSIFSARDYPGRWYPYGDRHTVLRQVVPCEGCMLEVCDKDNLCLKLISVDSVVEAICSYLN